MEMLLNSLASLDLSDNTIGNVGADALAKGLKEKNSSLTSRHLYGNHIGEVGLLIHWLKD